MRLEEYDIVSNGDGTTLGEVVEARNLRARVRWQGIVPAMNTEEWVSQIAPPVDVVTKGWVRRELIRVRDMTEEVKEDLEHAAYCVEELKHQRDKTQDMLNEVKGQLEEIDNNLLDRKDELTRLTADLFELEEEQAHLIAQGAEIL